MRLKPLLALASSASVVLMGAAIVSLPSSAASLPTAVIQTPAKDLRLWYTAPAPDSNDGWVDKSLPLGNGYMGVNAFGGTTSERLQITENSLMDSPAGSKGGLNNFAEVFLDFNHTSVTNYTRELSLNDAVAQVNYENAGVGYSREYFTSNPDKVLAVKLTASQAGGLSFTLRPTIPFETAYRFAEGDNRGKSGAVNASGDTITLSGSMHYYNVQFEGQFKVIPTGGTMVAQNDANGDGGTITVSNADSVVVLVAVGTNYQADPKVISLGGRLDKLAGFAHPHAKVTQYIADATAKGYDELKEAHEADYHGLYDRAQIDLGAVEPAVATDVLVDNYKAGTTDRYLEELAFQYGRYLLISSSRAGALPPNLQGLWNVYQDPPWTAGYWHNINLQMNYWPAFNTNLAELFDSYVGYYNTYLPSQRAYATSRVQMYNPSMADPNGDNGWAMGTSAYPLQGSPRAGHSGFGNGPWTAQLFWDYYDFTRDGELLADVVYPALRGQSNFMSRLAKNIGGKMLIDPSSSPEQTDATGAFPQLAGTTFDQQQTYENHRNTLQAAAILGLSSDTVLDRLASQMPLLDPIKIGRSGQIKEYRQEKYYNDLSAQADHRHTSQLLGQYPGQLINSSTPAWTDAVKKTLTLRGAPQSNVGWARAERIGHWARAAEGDKAYAEYKDWLKLNVLHNLWSNIWSAPSKTFQVEGNFGATAGVAEMLLQSNDGVVAPLAGLPSTWPTGSYEGLTARGNFEVSAQWSSGQAQQLEVTSKSGGELKVRYPNIGSAVVKTAGGASVSYTQQGSDQISLPTTAGETYVITAIPAHTKVSPPSNLSLTNLGNLVQLSWTASPNATSYSVYRAVGDAPGYTLVAANVTGTSYSYTDPTLLTTQQATYRVVANAGGRQSNGVTAMWVLPNLAEGKAATQSSTYGANAPARAVDGNTDGVYNNGSLANTTNESQPWWQVDLGKSETIDRVNVWNRTDSCCVSRLGDYYVLVSDQPITGTLAEALAQPGVHAYHQTSAPVPSSSILVGATGRYVRVQLTGTNDLNLAEVQVVPGIVNAALGKTATQSSTYSSNVAARAVDGNTSGVYASGSMTHTNSEFQPWWQVDLGTSKPIGKINVWNRTDSCCVSRLGDYYVLVSESPIVGTLAEALAQPGVTAYHETSAPSPARVLTVGQMGRYVRVQLTGTNYLSLAEVQVVPGPLNLAVGKTATQSSTGSSAPAARAVDGNTDGRFTFGSVTSTASSAQPWWQVDLGVVRALDDIVVWNRTDCCGTRLGDYYVLVSDSPITGTLAQALASPGVRSFHQTTAPSPSTRIDVGGTGRYVRVQLAGTDILHLAELQVLADTGA